MDEVLNNPSSTRELPVPCKRNLDCRVVEPEWLDHLLPEDARAARSRQDLVKLNASMGNARFIARALRNFLPQGPRTLADLGSGDGLFTASIACRVATRFPNTTVLLVDRNASVMPTTIAGFRSLGWHARMIADDVLHWLENAPPTDAMIANLFLHHFDSPVLARLLNLAATKTSFFVACEPRRSNLRYWTACALGLLGAGPVTRNDAPISVRAGFQDHELTSSWPSEQWVCTEKPAGLFSHLFIARKRSCSSPL